MSRPDYVPSREEDFFYWAFNLKTRLTEFGAEDLMPPPVYHELMRIGDDYEKKFAVTENPETRTAVTIKARQESRVVYEKYIRDMVQSFLVKNPKLTDAQRIAAGIPVHKTTHTPAPVNNIPPGYKVRLPAPGVVEISFFNAENNKTAKPEGQHGAKINWAVLDHPTNDLRELVNSATDTHTPYVLKFEGTESGKTVYFALRWVNTREEEGYSSKIYSSIIP
ncbi:MAG: hypothetical protein LBJ17_00235 [Dysgonamonadaceae bacterium]|jgi:hypothetical protein|nr:hypothetical protein [Dysgonamonadaceae bacterium]